MDHRTARLSRRRGALLRGAAALAIAAAILAPGACNSDSLGPLFGASGGGGGSGGGGFDPGIGGGLALRELFLGARIATAVPEVLDTYPLDGATGVHVRAGVAVTFSESVNSTSVLAGLRVFPQGSNTPVAGTFQLQQHQTVAVFLPVDDLLLSTSYELVIPATVTDLQGDQISGGEQRVRFTTQAVTDDPRFVVALSSPHSQSGNIVRGTRAFILFSEPVNQSVVGGGVFAPGNVTVRVNNAALTPGPAGDFVVGPVGSPRVLGISLAFRDRFPADADVEVTLSKDIQNGDGQQTLAGGQDFDLEFTVQDASIPEDLTFPNNARLADADGFISQANLHDFDAQVEFTSDGQASDSTTLIFFDATQENALLFTQDFASPTPFTVDLEPEDTAALGEGDILVGSFSERRGFRSEVSVLETLSKDTTDVVGPQLGSTGPPTSTAPLPSSLAPVFYTFVDDPILYGSMNEPSQGVSINFDLTDPLDFNSVQFAEGRSTVTGDFFVTAPTADFPLAPQLESYPAATIIATDVLRNGLVDTVTPLNVATVGLVGATVVNPPMGVRLSVSAFDSETFDFLGAAGAGTFGMVVVDEFPPDPTGMNQLVKGLAASSGAVTFTDAELSTLGTPRITVTLAVNGYDPVTVAGLDRPASAVAMLPILDKTGMPGTSSVVTLTIQGTGGSSTVLVGGVSEDLDTATAGQQRLFMPSGSVALPGNRLQVIPAIEDLGTGSFRFTASEPLALDPGTTTAMQTLDFSGLPLYSAADTNLAFQVTFDSGEVLSGGAVGLSELVESSQLRELRLVALPPGFVSPVAVGAQQGPDFTSAGALRTGTVLEPVSFTTNESVDADGVEDTSLELLMQPSLIQPGTAVDDPLIESFLQLELHIQDSTGAFTRQRFPLAPSQNASFQTVPAPIDTSAMHPPLVEWGDVVGGTNGAHVLHLVVPLSGRRWRIVVPEDVGTTAMPLQVPAIPTGFVDSSGGSSQPVVFSFGSPGQFGWYVESFDFDPPAGAPAYQFDINRFSFSDLERKHFKASQSDPTATVTTH